MAEGAPPSIPRLLLSRMYVTELLMSSLGAVTSAKTLVSTRNVLEFHVHLAGSAETGRGDGQESHLPMDHCSFKSGRDSEGRRHIASRDSSSDLPAALFARFHPAEPCGWGTSHAVGDRWTPNVALHARGGQLPSFFRLGEFYIAHPAGPSLASDIRGGELIPKGRATSFDEALAFVRLPRP